MISGVQLTPLKIINVLGGDVMHGMKNSDKGFSGFGEAYFSNIQFGKKKGWKLHKQMTLNLIVPIGAIRFILIDERENSKSKGLVQAIDLSKKNYQRLTVPPRIWMAFKGLNRKSNCLLNIGNIPHDPSEVESKKINHFKVDWSL